MTTYKVTTEGAEGVPYEVLWGTEQPTGLTRDEAEARARELTTSFNDNGTGFCPRYMVEEEEDVRETS